MYLEDVVLLILAPLCAIAAVLAALVATFYMTSFLKKLEQRNRITNPFILLLVTLMGAAIAFAITITLSMKILDMRAGFLRTTLATVAIATIAGCLFGLKTSSLRAYSVIQLLLALGLAVQTSYGLHQQIGLEAGVKLAGAVLALIGGMDNMKKDLEERAKLPPNVRGRIVTLNLAEESNQGG